MTHYEVLGVSPRSTAAEVRQAYLRLARRHHPDVNTGDSAANREAAEAEMRRINEAWAVLGNPDRRARYDADLRAAAARPQRRPARPPGTASPDFVPYDDDDDDAIDPALEDDTPITGGSAPRALQLAGPMLLLAAIGSACVGLVTAFRPFFTLAVLSFVGALVAFLLAPMLVVYRSSKGGR